MDEAKRYVSLLKEVVDVFKVGLELFYCYGPGCVFEIRGAGAKSIMLDLKLHDIPATVERTLRVLEDLPVSFVTLHVEPGYLFPSPLRLLGVTVLTSISQEDLDCMGLGMKLEDLVLKKAQLASSMGFFGVVCSGKEVKLIKDRFCELKTFVPGIRPSWWGKGDDQKRVMTPREAVEMGADYIIVGRPIRDSRDPLEAAVKIKKELEQVPL